MLGLVGLCLHTVAVRCNNYDVRNLSQHVSNSLNRSMIETHLAHRWDAKQPMIETNNYCKTRLHV